MTPPLNTPQPAQPNLNPGVIGQPQYTFEQYQAGVPMPQNIGQPSIPVPTNVPAFEPKPPVSATVATTQPLPIQTNTPAPVLENGGTLNTDEPGRELDCWNVLFIDIGCPLLDFGPVMKEEINPIGEVAPKIAETSNTIVQPLNNVEV